MSNILSFIILSTPLLLSGCFINSNFSVVNETIANRPNSKSPSLDNIIGSTSYATTSVSGYQVIQTVGIKINKAAVKTPNGYQVFLNISGRITSEDAK